MTTAPEPKPHAPASKPANGGKVERSPSAERSTSSTSEVDYLVEQLDGHKAALVEQLDAAIANERRLKELLYKGTQLVQTLAEQLKATNATIASAKTLAPLRSRSGKDQ